tara:strand:- start:289 stop:1017 length:729 start_codon:yes stop_codon:yes gene_type:complete
MISDINNSPGSARRTYRPVTIEKPVSATPAKLVLTEPSKLNSLARSLVDRVFSLLMLLFFLPFFATIAAIILFTEKGPVFFAHERIGKDGRTFRCLKFRTMCLDAKYQLEQHLANNPEARAQWEENQKLDNDPRITCVGEFLRKTSLDELPQFWNVLKGDMAVVGPRPIVADEMPRYGNHLSAYLSVKPGITGLWQVSGRSLTTYDERVALDVEYVQTRSFLKDAVIVLKTVKAVVTLEGAG